MPKKVERAIRAVAAKITPRAGETREAAAIKVLKSRGVIRQRGKHLAAGSKGR